MLTLPPDRRRFTTSTFLVYVSLLTFASADAVEVSRDGTNSRPFQWVPITTDARDRQSSDSVVKLDDATSDVIDVAHEEMWIAGFDSPVACDAYPVAGAACDGPWCCGAGRFWGRAEYLYWHMRGSEIPPLVTTSSAGTARDEAGVLGQATTTILLGNDRFTDDGQSGGRFGFGFWLGNCRDIGVEFIYTTLADQTASFSTSSDQYAILARPFFNIDTRAEDARILGFPSEVSGGIRVAGSAKYDVYELLIRRPVSRDCTTPTFIVYGYRSAELDDSLLISDSTQSLSGATSGTSIQSLDRFRSRNIFHGFEAGILTDFQISPCWQLNIEGKVAFGKTDHTTTIFGTSTATNSQGDSTTTPGGLLTQQSNIGRFESNSHGVLQDFTIRLHRSVWQGMTGSIGYSVHRWTDVARAAEQIDRSINPTQIPPGTLVGDARPEHRGNTSDFVAQGITFGLECAW